MKNFACQNCGNTIHFNNDSCLNCGSKIGYLADLFEMTALSADNGAWKALGDPGTSFYFCQNAGQAACNWLVPANAGQPFCVACRYNTTIPDLTNPAHLDHWRKIELAKKHLFYSLMRFHLPIPNRIDHPGSGLAFQFLANVQAGNGQVEQVLTGHSSGLIAINIAEADDAEREQRRAKMGEPYRTLIGHFRHEIGHFYWDLLIRDKGQIQSFADVFGNPDADYQQALTNYYANPGATNWQDRFISAYATSHPWEDFAETWAHCFHMVDGLETAMAYGLVLNQSGGGQRAAISPYDSDNFEEIFEAWVPLTVAINSVNRSLGQPDLYPFVLSEEIKSKLAYVFRVIRQSRI